MTVNSGSTSEIGFVAGVDVVELRDGVLDLQGYAYFADMPVDGYGKISTYLNLSQDSSCHRIRLGAVVRPDAELSSTESLGYSHSGVTTLAHTGLPLEKLPVGRWAVSFSASQAEKSVEAAAPAVIRHEKWSLARSRIVGSRATGPMWEIISLPAIGRDAVDAYIEELKCELDEDQRLLLEGYFVPRGREISAWGDISYSLVVAAVGERQTDGYIVASLPLACASRADASNRSGEPWRDQSKAYYATEGYRGCDLGTLAEGEYDLYVTARIGDDVQSFRMRQQLSVSGTWSAGNKPIVGVIGSCVTRDNFSSAVVPRWRTDFAFHGAQYQMALVSLMAEPVEFDAADYGDLDAHSLETTRRDFAKAYLGELSANPPDVLLFDAFADVRFGVIETEGSLVTNNAWKLGVAKNYSKFGGAAEKNMRAGKEEYLALFRDACFKLKTTLEAVAPKTKVVIVGAREAERYRGLEGTGRFERGAGSGLNEDWSELDRIATEAFGASSLDPMSNDTFGDSGHPWGRGPVHYEPKYYDRFRQLLLAKVGYKANLQLIQTS